MKRFKTVFLILPLILFLFLTLGCKSSMTPEPPEVKYYNIEITYIREQISNPSTDDRIHCYISSVGYTSSIEEHLDSTYFSKLDEYTFVSKIPYRTGSNEGKNPHKISFMDIKRWDGVHEGSIIVATKIILRVTETGFVLELQNIAKCDIKITPYKDDWAKMAQFWLTADGKPKNYK